MLSHTGSLWHYLGSFVLYTGLAIGLIYAVYWYTRKHGGMLLGLNRPTQAKTKLEVESMLTLEARKNIYVVRAGQERFLLATSMEGTQLLSRLEEETPAATEPEIKTVKSAAGKQVIRMERPVAASQAGEAVPSGIQLPFEVSEAGAKPDPKPGLGARFMQSVRWLAATRVKTS